MNHGHTPSSLVAYGDMAYRNGRALVMLHDQEGFPFEIGLLTARDRGCQVALIGVLIECAERNMSRKTAREFIGLYRSIFEPTSAEQSAISWWGE